MLLDISGLLSSNRDAFGSPQKTDETHRESGRKTRGAGPNERANQETRINAAQRGYAADFQHGREVLQAKPVERAADRWPEELGDLQMSLSERKTMLEEPIRQAQTDLSRATICGNVVIDVPSKT